MMPSYPEIKTRWQDGPINAQGETLYHFARKDILSLCEIIESLTSKLKTTDEILEDRYQVMRAIPECEAHGWNCVPHALEWVERAKAALAYLQYNHPSEWQELIKGK